MFDSQSRSRLEGFFVLILASVALAGCARPREPAPERSAPSREAHRETLRLPVLEPAYSHLQTASSRCAWAGPLEVIEQLDASEQGVHQLRLGCDDLPGAVEAIRAADQALDAAEPGVRATPALQWWQAARIVCPAGPISLEPIADPQSADCRDPAAIHFAWLARIAVAAARSIPNGIGIAQLQDAIEATRSRAFYQVLLNDLVIPSRDGYEVLTAAENETTLVARDARGIEQGRIVVSVHRAFTYFDLEPEPSLPDAEAVLGIVTEDPRVDDDVALRGLYGKRERAHARRNSDGREGTSLRITRTIAFGVEVRIAAFEADGTTRADPAMDSFVRGIVLTPSAETVRRLEAVLDRESSDELHHIVVEWWLGARTWQALSRVFAAADRTGSEEELVRFLDSLPAAGRFRDPCEGQRASAAPRPPDPSYSDAARAILAWNSDAASPHFTIFFARARDVGLDAPARFVLRAMGPTCGEHVRFLEFALGVDHGRLFSSGLPYAEAERETER